MRKDYNYQWNDDAIDKFLETELKKQGFICEFEKIVFNVAVQKNNYKHSVKIDLENVEYAKCTACGYKDNKLVDIKILPAKNESMNVDLYRNLDEIKVFVWSETAIKPICVQKIVSSTQWTIQ